MTAVSAKDMEKPVYALRPDAVLGPDGPILGAVLVVSGGQVAALCTIDELPPQYRSLDITRLESCTIVPGFIDTHHHVIEPFAKAVTCGEPAQMWKRIWLPLEATATPRTCYLGAKWTFLEALRGGVTTVVEHAIRSHDCVEAVHQAAEETGIRLVSSTGAYDLKDFETAADTPDASSTIDEALARAERHVRDCRSYSRIEPSLACGTVQSNSGKMIAALSRFCSERHILFQIHANEHTLEVHACIEAHAKRPIEYLHAIGALGPQTLLAHAVLVTKGEIDLIAHTGAAVAYNPVACIWKGNGVSPALEYIHRGIRVGLGSDATRNDGFRMIEAAETCQRIAFGQPNDDFSCGAGFRWIHAATQGGADACGLGSKTGALVAGRQADFLILDSSVPEVLPSWDLTWELVRYYDRADILATVVDGKPVVVGGRSTQFDSKAFVRDHLAEGAKWIRDTGIIRLHGPSERYRNC